MLYTIAGAGIFGSVLAVSSLKSDSIYQTLNNYIKQNEQFSRLSQFFVRVFLENNFF